MAHACLRAATLAAALLTSLAGLAAARAPSASAVASPAPAARAGGLARPIPLLLINGDRLLVAPGSLNATAVQQAPGDAGGAFLSITSGCSQTLKIPAAALPYLGRGLDPSLFSPGALERAERDGRLPLRLSYHGRLPALPGVTITRSGQGMADGYLTDDSARIFGTALRRQFAADHARGRYGTGGLFASGLSIALAGTPAPQQAQANFPMGTLTVTGSNLAGKSDTGDLALVFNLDNCNKLDPASSVNFFYHGAARFSVPRGHYWAAGVFMGASTDRLVILPQFTVGHGRTVHVSARAATRRITVKTPRPARLQSKTFTVLRSNNGFTEGVSWFIPGGSLRVGPVSHRRVARLHRSAAHLAARAGHPLRLHAELPGPTRDHPGPALHCTSRGPCHRP
jgi:hypothetical protein